MRVSLSASRLLERLRREPSDADRKRAVELHASIERRVAGLAAVVPTEAAAQTLTHARIESSNTLRNWRTTSTAGKRRAHDAWQTANELVVAAVSAETAISIEGLRRVNASLVGNRGVSLFRAEPAFLDGERCPAPADVERLLRPMLAVVQRRTDADGVLFGAALLYQWLVSVHPFADANGRTARLATDWLLGLHGYVPISFDDAFDAFVAVHPGTPEAETRTVRDALEVVGLGVLHTLDLIAATKRSG